eukprot:1621445-Rhodomonas_salina.1
MISKIKTHVHCQWQDSDSDPSGWQTSLFSSCQNGFDTPPSRSRLAVHPSRTCQPEPQAECNLLGKLLVVAL